MIVISLQFCVNMIKSDCMPKKSKKEKVIAAYHRKYKLLKETAVAVQKSDKFSTLDEKKVIIKPPQKIISSDNNEQDRTIRNFFLSDLKKTLFLIFSIIVLEIGLYFVSINNYFLKK